MPGQCPADAPKFPCAWGDLLGAGRRTPSQLRPCASWDPPIKEKRALLTILYDYTIGIARGGGLLMPIGSLLPGREQAQVGAARGRRGGVGAVDLGPSLRCLRRRG